MHFFLRGGRRDGRFVGQKAGENAKHVAVDGRRRQFEADRADRSGRVVADAAKRADLVVLRRKHAAVVADDLLRGALQIPRAAIIPEPFPKLVQPFGRDARQREDVGQLGDKAAVMIDRRLDARLLQHDLGDQNVIRLAVHAPGKVSGVRFIPRQKRAGKKTDRGRGHGEASFFRKRMMRENRHFEWSFIIA